MIIVGLVLSGVAYIVAFGALVAFAARGRRVAHVATGAAVPVVVGAAVAAYAALVVFLQRCDEACDDGSAHHWWTSEGSWQWAAQLAIAAIVLGAALGVVAQTARGRYGTAVALLCATATAAAAWGRLRVTPWRPVRRIAAPFFQRSACCAWNAGNVKAKTRISPCEAIPATAARKPLDSRSRRRGVPLLSDPCLATGVTHTSTGAL